MNVTRVEATDPDDDEVVFDIVGDATVLAEGPLLRIVNDGHKTATVFLNSRLNAVVCSFYASASVNCIASYRSARPSVTVTSIVNTRLCRR